jgi:hypothetical protein
MRDPISGPIDFGFFVFSFIVVLWVAIDSRRVLEFLFSSAKPLSPSIVFVLRILAGICAAGLAVVLIRHAFGSR